MARNRLLDPIGNPWLIVAVVLLGFAALILLSGCCKPPPKPEEDNSSALISTIITDGGAKIADCLGADGKHFKVLIPSYSRKSAGSTCPDGKHF